MAVIVKVSLSPACSRPFHLSFHIDHGQIGIAIMECFWDFDPAPRLERFVLAVTTASSSKALSNREQKLPACVLMQHHLNDDAVYTWKISNIQDCWCFHTNATTWECHNLLLSSALQMCVGRWDHSLYVKMADDRLETERVHFWKHINPEVQEITLGKYYHCRVCWVC